MFSLQSIKPMLIRTSDVFGNKWVWAYVWQGVRFVVVNISQKVKIFSSKKFVKSANINWYKRFSSAWHQATHFAVCMFRIKNIFHRGTWKYFNEICIYTKIDTHMKSSHALGQNVVYMFFVCAATGQRDIQ